ERRQLQNGADAASLALAQSCAKGNCVAGADSLAALTNSNAGDGHHKLAGQCLMNKPTTLVSMLPACTASSLAPANCPPLPPGYAAYATALPYVEVRTSTLSAGSSKMTNVFRKAAGERPGVVNSPSSEIGACARSAWGT